MKKTVGFEKKVDFWQFIEVLSGLLSAYPAEVFSKHFFEKKLKGIDFFGRW